MATILQSVSRIRHKAYWMSGLPFSMSNDGMERILSMEKWYMI